MMSRSASGEGVSSNALMIHCLFGMITSSARIAAPPSQFTMMRILSTMYAIGGAADDEIGLDMIHNLPCYRISNKLFIAVLILQKFLRLFPNLGIAGRRDDVLQSHVDH